MRATRLLRTALEIPSETVLDCAVGTGKHAIAFLSKGKKVTGLDIFDPKLRHTNYTAKGQSFEEANLPEFDLVWSCHTLEHVENPGFFLRSLRKWTKTGGWLAIAVPPGSQDYFHIGHLTLWTPAHLAYNLVTAGWNCKEAKWYTEDRDIGFLVQKTADISFTGRTAMPTEIDWLQQFMPAKIEQQGNSWWPNNWHEETGPRQLIPSRLVS